MRAVESGIPEELSVTQMIERVLGDLEPEGLDLLLCLQRLVSKRA